METTTSLHTDVLVAGIGPTRWPLGAPGHIAQSWVGNGPNQAVSPQQLQNVFGNDQVQVAWPTSPEWLRKTS